MCVGYTRPYRMNPSCSALSGIYWTFREAMRRVNTSLLPRILDPQHEDFEGFVSADAEEREQIPGCRVIHRLHELTLHD